MTTFNPKLERLIQLILERQHLEDLKKNNDPKYTNDLRDLKFSSRFYEYGTKNSGWWSAVFTELRDELDIKESVGDFYYLGETYESFNIYTRKYIGTVPNPYLENLIIEYHACDMQGMRADHIKIIGAQYVFSLQSGSDYIVFLPIEKCVFHDSMIKRYQEVKSLNEDCTKMKNILDQWMPGVAIVND